MSKWIVGTLLLLGFMVAWAGMVFFSAIKPEPFHTSKTPSDYNVAYERLTLFTDDGLKLAGWLLPNADSRAVLVIGHGYPFDKGSMLAATIFLNQYFNLIYFDFRYFGESEGRYATFGDHERLDVKAVIDFIEERPELDASKIGLLGYSYSSNCFIQSNPKQASVMVLDSSFASVGSMAKKAYRWLPGPLKTPMIKLSNLYSLWYFGSTMEKASALDVVADMRLPILFLHGDQDRQVSVNDSKKLFEKCGSQDKSFVIIPKATHNINHEKRVEFYHKQLVEFLKQHLGG